MSKSTVRFAPWVGAHYERGIHGLRILVVCESHYGAKEHERPTATPEVLKALALGQKHPQATAKLRQHAHFTKIMASILNARKHFSKADRSEFWHSVAYYNFIQDFLPSIRKAPSRALWEKGERSFTEVLEVLAPELIVCFSKRNRARVTSLAGGVPVAVANHPSSHFAYSTVNPIIAKQIELALARKAQLADFARTSDLYLRWCEATASAVPTPGKYLSASDRLKLIAKRRESMAAVDEAALA